MTHGLWLITSESLLLLMLVLLLSLLLFILRHDVEYDVLSSIAKLYGVKQERSSEPCAPLELEHESGTYTHDVVIMLHCEQTRAIRIR